MFALIVFLGCGKGNEPPVEQEMETNFNATVPKEIFNGQDVTVSVTGQNIIKVEVYVVDKLETTLLAEPFTTTLRLIDLNVGKQTITIIAEYKNGKKDKKSFEFQFKVKEGMEYQGGIIVFLDAKGEHGIIAAKEDLSDGSLAGMYYFDHGYGSGGVTYNAYDEDNGLNNSQLINGSEPDMLFVACKKYRGGGFDDWYIPAVNEFQYLEKHDKALGLDVSSKLYWTSTLIDKLHAKLFCFGRCAYILKDCELNRYHYGRAVRRF